MVLILEGNSWHVAHEWRKKVRSGLSWKPENKQVKSKLSLSAKKKQTTALATRH